jgi:phage FluMu protein gp41
MSEITRADIELFNDRLMLLSVFWSRPVRTTASDCPAADGWAPATELGTAFSSATKELQMTGNAVLTGLRLLQRDIANNGGEFSPLTVGKIDKLCEHLVAERRDMELLEQVRAKLAEQAECQDDHGGRRRAYRIKVTADFATCWGLSRRQSASATPKPCLRLAHGGRPKIGKLIWPD